MKLTNKRYNYIYNLIDANNLWNNKAIETIKFNLYAFKNITKRVKIENEIYESEIAFWDLKTLFELTNDKQINKWYIENKF